jgi:hypothetical protein
VLWLQAFVAAQPGQIPPQSTSVSVPFFRVSPQLASWHFPLTQCALAQSPFFLQPLPFGQGPQASPPQSWSVSVPPFSPSVQPGPTHTRVTAHTPVAQSPDTWQPAPTPQALHAPPPQSLPVSFPFFVASVQVALAQCPSTQRREAQSVPPTQTAPSWQEMQLPPQSGAVSAPFCTLSVQSGG